MVKIIMGLKGSGKTKRLVDLVRETVAEDNGDVVVIENNKNLMINEKNYKSEQTRQTIGFRSLQK